MLDAAPDAMVGVGEDGLIVLANSRTETLFGYEREELIGRPVELLIPDRFRGSHPGHVARYLAEPRTRPMGAGLDLAGRRADGTEFPAEISLNSIDTEDGLVALAAIRDITDRKKAEEELHRARKEADRANKEKNEFLSRMSHELRTPLNSILGFAQLLDMEELTADQRASVERILSGGEHLLTLINEILDIAQIESGRITISPEPVHLGQALNEAIALVRPLADQSVIRLIEPEGDDDVYVRADRQRLNQVLLNLLSNAIKFNREDGEVRIACRRSTPGAYRVDISDTGMGISEEHSSELFTPFARLGAEERGIEGTGLGLTLSKGLVDIMGGKLGASSTAGVGSTFWIELPLAEESQPESLETSGARLKESTTTMPHTVLYIEDNVANLQLIERILAHRPAIRLLSAMQGSLGIELAKQHRPDLILLDLHLPDMPGEDVLRRLLHDDQTKDIPVLIISADTSDVTLKRISASGAATFITKPVNVSLFLEAIDGILS
jgi:protein-histidine pros-kinase